MPRVHKATVKQMESHHLWMETHWKKLEKGEERGKKGRQDGYQGQTCPASPSIFVLRKTQLHASSVPFNSGVLLTGKCNPVMVPGSVNESELFLLPCWAEGE